MYISPELNVVKLWRNWKLHRNQDNMDISSLSKFKKIFYTNFNDGFGNPSTDVCSFCETQKKLIRETFDMKLKVEKFANYHLHKLKAKNFYSFMKEKNKNIIKVCFDMQQNQPIPKLSVGDVFYAQQICLYNLTFVRHDQIVKNKDNIFIHNSLETQNVRGSNEECSGLVHFLSKLEKDLKLGKDCFLKDNQKMVKQVLKKKKNANSNEGSEKYNLLSRED